MISKYVNMVERDVGGRGERGKVEREAQEE